MVPLSAVGHINACIGLAQPLLAAGHRVSMTLTDSWRGQLTKYGIEEVIIKAFGQPLDKSAMGADVHGSGKQSVSDGIKHLLEDGSVADLTPLEKASRFGPIIRLWMEKAVQLDSELDRVIPDLKPDCLILDQLMHITAAELSGLPYVLSWSPGPLIITSVSDERLPPCASGLSAYGDPNEWKQYRQVWCEAIHDVWHEFNSYVISRGCRPLATNNLTKPDDCLNLYGYPLELDYQDVRPLPENFYRFDNLMRRQEILDNNNPAMFDIPESLRLQKLGKLVYFSMGTLGSVDVVNMKRLVNILAKSPNRFIVSMGPKHYEYSPLPAANMWGQSSVPQTQVLPLVDLVITHGGSNTVTETMAYGKPMIVLPLFGDQWDNARRLDDLGLGIQLDAYRCTESELLAAVDRLTADTELAKKLSQIAERIQSENSLTKLPEILVNYVNGYRKL
ncbi:NDP-glycosyltransferase YjiC-like [Oppia nitens]|uniref:NDP-glycosyltransferase YjiC-like n=1 Tax=Oppia nitens TaxID=1686743 RepID=UPI0023DC6ADF|nr:NDP-glycosyltransferase YjiC-like [Oppia nitens]